MSDVGTFGYGQLRTEDFGSDANAVAFVARQLIGQIATAKIVKVVAVHAGSGTEAGTVDVQPLVKQTDGNGYAVSHGTVFGLPYFRLQAGPWAIIAEPAAGDTGLIICADRDSSSVVRSGGEATPPSRRRYNIADGIYFGGIGLFNAAPQASFQFNSDGTFTLSDQSGNVLKTTSSGFELTGNLAVTGDVTATGAVAAGQGGAPVGLQTHTHPSNDSPPTPGT
jgi:hypothetical protein